MRTGYTVATVAGEDTATGYSSKDSTHAAKGAGTGYILGSTDMMQLKDHSLNTGKGTVIGYSYERREKIRLQM